MPKIETYYPFTQAQLDEVRRVALERGFEAFTNDDGRTIYLNEDYAPARYESGVEIVLIDRDVVWLDRYDRNADDSIKAEADGTASTLDEVIAKMKERSTTMDSESTEGTVVV